MCTASHEVQTVMDEMLCSKVISPAEQQHADSVGTEDDGEEMVSAAPACATMTPAKVYCV